MSQNQIKVIAFDVFGTLARIKQKISPYKKFIQWLHRQGHTSQISDAVTVMSINGDFQDIATHLGYQIPPAFLDELNTELQTELAQIELFADTLPTLNQLKENGYKIVLCSNSATPYGIHIRSLITEIDIYAWSYEVHACKPDPAIYQYFIDQLQCTAEEVLFVGDTPLADIQGPTAFGMSAKLIDRKNGQTLHDVLNDYL
ncbi:MULTISPECIES: HAD family hydrolase [unclassified Acinetobacter]|uniref:HAD family hydrolase n=1 Tax=unclassified Acinetobacter TaxID=196816 RepID=UPI002576C0CE|nr:MULTISPECIES: HAD family hydrolase [unclassified Acinetobacter]MDM1757504.1 HAD family hydrolase [Acinetobacter sp. 256-1]MDM1761517.1 HAD family hydrolase [Acinetobacter sp. 251-1]